MKKICIKCNILKLLTDFSIKSQNKGDGRANDCKKCHGIYCRNHYKINRKQYFDRNVRRRNEIRKLILIEKNKPCVDCNEKYPPYVMDFDHREDKDFNIGEAASRNYALDKIKKELEKCDLVCSNCHRERTFGKHYGMGK